MWLKSRPINTLRLRITRNMRKNIGIGGGLQAAWPAAPAPMTLGGIVRTALEVLEKSKAPLGDKADAVAAVIAGGGPIAGDFKVEGGVVKKR